jgi:Zn-dependent peptidase ImmA (M78 family)
VTIFGQRDLWAIEVDPLPGAPVEHDPAAAATWCSIRIWAEGRNLTAHTRKQSATTSDALHWPAAYLARWFVRSWSGFWERAGWPLPGPIVDAELACRKLDQHLAELGPDADEDLLDRRDAFVASHSLLAAAAGGLMPHVYWMREGPTVHVTWREPAANDSDVAFHEPQGRARLSADVVLDAVVEFLRWCGEAVAGHDSDLATEIDQWLARIDRPEAAEAVLRGYIRPWGVPASRVAMSGIDPRLELPEHWQSLGARLDPARFPAAVVFRALAPAVNVDDVLVLLDRLRSYPSVPEASRALDALRIRLVVPSSELPHQQGYNLAEQLRMARSNLDAYFDIEAFLAEIGVKVDTANLSDVKVDGATVWGAQHGPVIVLNQMGARQEPWARRMILAHELCHLLVDRPAAAELMVASTPWAPPELERRANAFAAELLLPKAGILRVAGDAVRSGWAGEADRSGLMAEFQVGATVCAHQLENRLRISE